MIPTIAVFAALGALWWVQTHSADTSTRLNRAVGNRLIEHAGGALAGACAGFGVSLVVGYQIQATTIGTFVGVIAGLVMRRIRSSRSA